MKLYIAVVAVALLQVSLAAEQKEKHVEAQPVRRQATYTSNGQVPAATQGVQSKPVYPAIIQHKQALNNDGSFQFQYAADNGLQHGESVGADGTRKGSYSYVGADGKTITVKYTAGKDGFVAEGDHLPRQPSPLAVGAPAGDGGAYQGGAGAYQGGAGAYQGGAGAYQGAIPATYRQASTPVNPNSPDYTGAYVEDNSGAYAPPYPGDEDSNNLAAAYRSAQPVNSGQISPAQYSFQGPVAYRQPQQQAYQANPAYTAAIPRTYSSPSNYQQTFNPNQGTYSFSFAG